METEFMNLVRHTLLDFDLIGSIFVVLDSPLLLF